MSTEVQEWTAAKETMLAACEQELKETAESFIRAGNALMRIRDSQLYRKTHDTFEDYCKEKWGMSIRFAQMKMSAAKATATIEANNCSRLPENEAQARPLTQLEPDEQADAWQEALDTSPTDETGEPIVTASHVAEVVAKRKPKAEAPKPSDAAPIQQHDSTDDEIELIEIRERVLKKHKPGPSRYNFTVKLNEAIEWLRDLEGR